MNSCLTGAGVGFITGAFTVACCLVVVVVGRFDYMKKMGLLSFHDNSFFFLQFGNAK